MNDLAETKKIMVSPEQKALVKSIVFPGWKRQPKIDHL
jgi:hypothetical protein